MDTERTANKIKEYIKRSRTNKLSEYLSELHPADISNIFDHLELDEKKTALNLLEPQKAGSVISEMEGDYRKELLDALDRDCQLRILKTLPPHSAADILGEMSPEDSQELLEAMEEKEVELVEEIMEYEEDSAGAIMTTDCIFLDEKIMVQDAIKELRSAQNVDSISYIYVADERNHLIGALSLRELIISREDQLLRDIMNPKLISAAVDTDQEEVSHLIQKYGLRSLPIVDKDGCLAGRVTAENAMNVIVEEATEDIYKMAGTDDEEISKKSILQVVCLRLPWIIVSLIGGIIAATILKNFDSTLRSVIALTFFIPVIMGMGGNIGIQSSTITVRGLAVGRIELSQIWRVLSREVRTGMLMGIICGTIVGAAALLFQKSIILGVIVALSMFIAITIAATLGVLVPLAFKKLRIDPAISTGPFVTMANDLTGLLIYFFLASCLVRYMA